MKIKNFEMFLENLKPKARKLARIAPTAVVIAGLAMTPITAEAAVRNDEILGDAQVQEDRQNIKYHDAYLMNSYFYGYDEYGCVTVSLDSLCQAMEMSDALNLYNAGNLELINTTRDEVLGLNVPGLYQEFQANPYGFAATHQEDRAAMDAYITFGTRTVETAMRDEIASRVYGYLIAQGKNVTVYPYVTITKGEVSCMYEVNGQAEKIVLYGDRIEDIKSQYLNLDQHYNMALHSINGTSDDYENQFAYNGVRKGTGESVWLSIGSDDLKGELREAIEFTRGLQNAQSYDIVPGNSDEVYLLNPSEAQSLREQGYHIPDVNNVRVNVAYLRNALTLEHK